MSYTRRNEPYNDFSERLEAVPALLCYGHKWSNLHHDACPNRQKLFCRNERGLEFVIVAEYTDAHTALLEIDDPDCRNFALRAIQTVFPASAIVGDNQLIRVLDTTTD